MPSPSLPLNSLDKLIAEHKLLRILSPDVSQQIKSHRRSPYVIEYDKQIYLSLEHILDDKQRQYYYQAIQRHQAGQNVDLMTLPHELQRILQPNLVPPTRFWEPLIIGGIVGLVIGVLAMAVGTLFLNVTAVTLETATLSDPSQIHSVCKSLLSYLSSFRPWVGL